MVDLKIRFIVRDYESVVEFLYEGPHNYFNKLSARKFDQIDIVIIDGPLKHLPWNKCTVRVSVLVRMCLRTKKLLLTAGLATLALVVTCSTEH